jgi:small subunit ribosomal protein S8
MTLNDPLANVLSHILIEDKKGKRQIITRPYSKIMLSVLNLLKDNNYLGDVKYIKDTKGGHIEINLLGAINKVGVIKPRYSVKITDYEKFERRYLPAFGFGFLVVSTTQGIMSQEDAIKKGLGGRLLAYVY